MGGWTQLRDASWHRIECVFGLQRTPPIRRVVDEPPPAPRKICLGDRKQQLARRENLRPRKLTYEPENQRRVEPSHEDSGIVVWATTSSSLLDEDADKENRPENDDIIPNSQNETANPGSLRYRLEQLMASLSIEHQPNSSGRAVEVFSANYLNHSPPLSHPQKPATQSEARRKSEEK
ncbi:uncharacterized protein LOC100679784 isoform X2 [Nasonia vitripennis]|uniref:Uncharacterized protein n=1 Tax=Nasonia vitripennis TaxID=7425 RepID=A0A7M7R3B5_NASVI|nr:uncharacterized protein LOC100679784 isoform X2 [Nasonia vitripennis]